MFNIIYTIASVILAVSGTSTYAYFKGKKNAEKEMIINDLRGDLEDVKLVNEIEQNNILDSIDNVRNKLRKYARPEEE
jgi:hypothetical protein